MQIPLHHIEKDLVLEIVGNSEDSPQTISEQDAVEYGEAQYQIKEGCTYEYNFPKKEHYQLSGTNGIVSVSKFHKNTGLIKPNIFVGTLTLEIINSENGNKNFVNVEVQSVKSEYRTDYRFMLERITEKCTELIMQIDSPINQHFETNFDIDNRTLYQKFSFVKSVIDSREFEEAIQKIVSSPALKWQTETEEKDIRNIRRFSQKNIKQIISKNNRVELPSSHYLHTNYQIESIASKIESARKIESVDTSENRFIKHALEVFLFFCENCELKFDKYSNAKSEAENLSVKISNLLTQSFFKEISRATILKINSTVLQRKSGYREVLNAWLKYDLAAKLTWNGGDNVYDAGKKDVAKLYEYWLFFYLLELFESIFDIKPKDIQQLIEFDKNNLNLKLKQGSAIALKGIYTSATRNLNIQFSFNRAFGGGKTYPDSGSYTTTLRPDYTLSIWPAEIEDSKEAEIQEIITHIHFDAKYKVNNFYDLISKPKGEELTNDENEDLIKEEEEENEKGTFKNQDLLKMHAYKDAIRRTGGAYVLYPGKGKDEPFRGFHELIPGLGAFVVRPNNDPKEKKVLENFILKVIDNFLDRASQRENLSSKVYHIHKDRKNDDDLLKEPMPEYLNNRKLIPDDSFVMVGYYKSQQHLKWIEDYQLYNFRTGTERGSLPLGAKEVGASFLVLHGPSETDTDKIYKLKEMGPKIYSKQDLKNKKYPTEPSGDLYVIFEIEKDISLEFDNQKWDLKKLDNFKNFRSSAKPITVSLVELMEARI